MTSLNNHIPIKFIKNCKKLQKIECDYFYRWIEAHNDYEIECGDKSGYDPHNIDINYNAPTIADIIDNAEMLFGECYQTIINSYVKNIIIMCQQNRSIEEISKYIINNIK